MSTITIVGATGNLGSKTVQNLLDKGHQLRLVARNSDKLQQFAGKKGVTIHAGDSVDGGFLAEVIKGSDVVMLMMPTDLQCQDIRSFQDRLGIAQIDAIKKSNVRKVLFISSVGGHTEDGTGIVAGLAKQEARLKALENIDLLILRPSYFMENFLGNIAMIKNMGINGSPIAADKAFPVIATRDIAIVAAKKLDAMDWSGKNVLPLLGPKDYTMNEITKSIGKAIGKPDLSYVQFPYEEAKKTMVQWGISESVAEAFVTMNEAINTGKFNTEIRNSDSTTPTTIGEFAKTFASVYNQN